MGDDSDDSDEWGTEELDIPAKLGDKNQTETVIKDDDQFWAQPEPVKDGTHVPEATTIKARNSSKDDRPCIIVDMTRLNEAIHNKFDKNGCSDAEKASALRKKIEQNFQDYAKNSEMLADGTVIPSGLFVWRGALQRLRDERPGHYFAPIFPPKAP